MREVGREANGPKVAQREKTFWLEAKPLVETRFDTKVKFLYVRAYVTHQDYEFWQDVYKQHLWVFNKFKENKPAKKCYEDFESSFNNLIDDFRVGNFVWEKSPVPVYKGYLNNGAHRVATSLFFGNKVLCYEDNRRLPVWDDKFFLKRGLSKEIIRRVNEEF